MVYTLTGEARAFFVHQDLCELIIQANNILFRGLLCIKWKIIQGCSKYGRSLFTFLEDELLNKRIMEEKNIINRERMSLQSALSLCNCCWIFASLLLISQTIVKVSLCFTAPWRGLFLHFHACPFTGEWNAVVGITESAGIEYYLKQT